MSKTTKLTTNPAALYGILRSKHPEAAIVRGWHLDGAGPARHGWGAVYPTGHVRFLGRTLLAAAQKCAAG